MMNSVKSLGIGFIACLSFLSILSACHKDSIETVSDSEPLPVILTTAVSKIQTKVLDSSFEEDDEIGVFLLEQPHTLIDERYADNVRFVCNHAEWTPDEQLFFPKGESRSNFIAYYPYQPAGVVAGKSSLTCEVKADQSVHENYSNSDFLVATLNDVTPTKEAIALNFKHKLTAVEIIIEPGSAYTSAQELLDARPVILIKNVCTSAEYDFLSGTVTQPTKQSDIVPGGEFMIRENKLVGKRAVIVPQSITGGQILITLSVGGRTFNFTLGEDYKYLPGTRETYTLTLVASIPEDIPGTISASVSQWENENTHDENLVEDNNTNGNTSGLYIVSIPDFTGSSVYKAANGDKQVAEICREYLKAMGVDNQAIVAYPVKNGKADHTAGIVLQLLDGNKGKPLSASVHGGSVSWDESTGLLTYKKGVSTPLTVVYMDEEGNISDKSDGKNLVAATLKPDLLKDARENVTYPVIKIGTQYWMGENLRATMLVNGSAIAVNETNAGWKATAKTCCYYPETNEVLYKIGVLSEEIAPDGWKIPTIAEWNRMIAYVAANAVLLMDESWKIADSKLNLTGFSAPKIGIRSSDGSYYDKAQGFWHSEGSYAYISNNTVSIYPDENTSGCSIRCIRK